MQGNYFIYCDSEKCLACKSCLLACAEAHAAKDATKAMSEKTTLTPRNSLISKDSKIKAVQCRQCEEAVCTSACKVKAINQENGMVMIDVDKCVGCRACAKVCLYRAITMAVPYESNSSNGKPLRPIALKCELCHNRSMQACIAACPTKALRLARRYYKIVSAGKDNSYLKQETVRG